MARRPPFDYITSRYYLLITQSNGVVDFYLVFYTKFRFQYTLNSYIRWSQQALNALFLVCKTNVQKLSRTLNYINIMQPVYFNVFLHGNFLQVTFIQTKSHHKQAKFWKGKLKNKTKTKKPFIFQPLRKIPRFNINIIYFLNY